MNIDLRDNYERKRIRKGVHELIHNAKLTGRISNPTFLRRLHSLGVLYFEDDRYIRGNPVGTHTPYSLKTFEQFISVLSLAKAHYGDNADIHVTYVDDEMYSLSIKVLYPKITIKNSLGISKVLINLIVVYRFSYREITDSLVLCSITGGRPQVTPEEASASYLQSHLSSTDWFGQPLALFNFCLGSLTPVESIKSKLNSQFTLELYEDLFFSVNTMVKWESLEGVPYRRIISVKTAGSSLIEENAMAAMLTSFEHIDPTIYAILNRYTTLPLNFYVDQGKVRIKQDEKAQKFIAQVIQDRGATTAYTRTGILCNKVPNSTSFAYPLQKKDLTYQLSPGMELEYTIFNTRFIHVRLLQSEAKKEEELPSIKVVHPKYLDYVIRALEHELYKEFIRAHRAEINYSNRDANRSIASDTVFVQEYT